MFQKKNHFSHILYPKKIVPLQLEKIEIKTSKNKG